MIENHRTQLAYESNLTTKLFVVSYINLDNIKLNLLLNCFKF